MSEEEEIQEVEPVEPRRPAGAPRPRCECGAKLPAPPAPPACPGCGIAAGFDTFPSDEPVVSIAERKLPVRLWEEEVLLAAAVQVLRVRALTLVFLGLLCALKFETCGVFLFLLPALFWWWAAKAITERRDSAISLVTPLEALLDLGVASLVANAMSLGGGARGGLPRGLAGFDWPVVFLWGIAFVTQSMTLYFLSFRRTASRVWRDCYRDVPLTPIWEEPSGRGTWLRGWAARFVVMLAFGTGLGLVSLIVGG